jgi:hypothetical protein
MLDKMWYQRACLTWAYRQIVWGLSVQRHTIDEVSSFKCLTGNEVILDHLRKTIRPWALYRMEKPWPCRNTVAVQGRFWRVSKYVFSYRVKGVTVLGKSITGGQAQILQQGGEGFVCRSKNGADEILIRKLLIKAQNLWNTLMVRVIGVLTSQFRHLFTYRSIHEYHLRDIHNEAKRLILKMSCRGSMWHVDMQTLGSSLNSGPDQVRRDNKDERTHARLASANLGSCCQSTKVTVLLEELVDTLACCLAVRSTCRHPSTFNGECKELF